MLKLFFNRDDDSAIKEAIETGRVSLGKNVEIGCRFYFTGSGRLEIGDGVKILPAQSDPKKFVTFCTYSETACITIGPRTILEGTRFGCQSSIKIGKECYIGESNLMDTDFHSADPYDRDNPEKIQVGPVVVGNRVKIASYCAVLRGVKIGEESVVRPFSIVSSSLPPQVTAFGYPAKIQTRRV